MRRPRRGILIRILIYVPIIGYLGWMAAQRWRAEREVSEDAAELESVQGGEQPYQQKIKMPDGSVREVTVVTPEQAEEMYGVPNAKADAKADAKAPAGD